MILSFGGSLVLKLAGEDKGTFSTVLLTVLAPNNSVMHPGRQCCNKIGRTMPDPGQSIPFLCQRKRRVDRPGYGISGNPLGSRSCHIRRSGHFEEFRRPEAGGKTSKTRPGSRRISHLRQKG